MNITFEQHPKVWRHPNWGRLQLRLFAEECKIRREKNIEDYIINNGINKVHVLKDNKILDKFFNEHNIQLVTPDNAELVIITDQRFSRFTVKNMITELNLLLDSCPRIYFCLNRYYLNAAETFVDPGLPEHFDTAIVKWLENNLRDTVVLNRSEIFVEDGSCFTWVVPSCEVLLCRK